MLFVLCSICTGAQERFEVFVSPSPVEPHYRIPAMASLADGTVICVADYRYSLRDVGIVKDGRIDLCSSAKLPRRLRRRDDCCMWPLLVRWNVVT